MNYYSCIAKRTRSGTAMYLAKLFNEGKENRGDCSESKSESSSKGTYPSNSSRKRKGFDSEFLQPERISNREFNHDNLCKAMEAEKICGNGAEEETLDSKIEPKSNSVHYEDDDAVDVDDDSCEEIEVEGSRGNGPDDQFKETEVKEIEDIEDEMVRFFAEYGDVINIDDDFGEFMETDGSYMNKHKEVNSDFPVSSKSNSVFNEVEESDNEVHCDSVELKSFESDSQLETNLSSTEVMTIDSDEDEIDFGISSRTRLKMGMGEKSPKVDETALFTESDIPSSYSETSIDDPDDDFDLKDYNSSVGIEEMSSSLEEGEEDDSEDVDEEENEGSDNEEDIVGESEEEKSNKVNGIRENEKDGGRLDRVSTDSNDIQGTGEEKESGKEQEFRNSTKRKQAIFDKGGQVGKEKERGKETDSSKYCERRRLFGMKERRELGTSKRTYERKGNNYSKGIYKENGESKLNRRSADIEEECGRAKVGGKEEELRESASTKQEIAEGVNGATYDRLNDYGGTSEGCGIKNSGKKEKKTTDFTKRKRVCPPKDYDIVRILVDSTFDKEKSLEGEVYKEDANKPSSVEFTLPLKFRFEDDETESEEKSELDEIADNLFAEMEFALRTEEICSYDRSVVENQKTKIPEEAETTDSSNTTVLDGEANQTILCRSGKHHLVLDEEIGLKCLFCSYVDLEIQHITPNFLQRKCTQEASERRYIYGNNDFSMFEFQDSRENSEDLLNHIEGTVWDIIPGIGENMYQHQQKGFEFLWKNLGGTIDLATLKTSDSIGVGGCIISHAPGTGKTRLTIVFLATYLKLFPNCRPVIIAPAGMLLTWEEEFRKWNVGFPFHNLNTMELSGKEDKTALELLPENKIQQREAVRMVKIYSWSKDKSVLGVSYNLYEMIAGEKFTREKGKRKKTKVVGERVEQLRKILLEFPGLIIFDEGHTPRNDRSRIWNTLLKLKSEKRVILSGTPFQNNFGELFNTLRLVRPAIADVLAEEKTFIDMVQSQGRKYRRKKSREKGDLPVPHSTGCRVGDYAIEKLKATISPFVHVHKGSILQKSLPGLRDSVVLLNPPRLQKTLIDRTKGPQTMEFEHKMALVSVHPCLILGCTLTDKEKSAIDQGSLERLRLNPDEGVKTRFIMELMRLSDAMNERVLIFSQYLKPLELIKDQIREIFSWNEGNEILEMEGKLDQKNRQNLINLFNDPKSNAKIMLASTKCCSEGINLVGASRVVLLDVVWNPSVERQAISRAYRLGQKRVVYTYHLMTSGTTEGDKYYRQAEKDRLSELVFCSTSKENAKQNVPASACNDKILEEMVGHEKLKDMFEKIIHQPKEKNLVESFTLASLS